MTIYDIEGNVHESYDPSKGFIVSMPHETVVPEQKGTPAVFHWDETRYSNNSVSRRKVIDVPEVPSVPEHTVTELRAVFVPFPEGYQTPTPIDERLANIESAIVALVGGETE